MPDEWTLYYLEARVLAGFDPAGAANALEQARELNPTGPEIEALQAEMDHPERLATGLAEVAGKKMHPRRRLACG